MAPRIRAQAALIVCVLAPAALLVAACSRVLLEGDEETISVGQRVGAPFGQNLIAHWTLNSVDQGKVVDSTDGGHDGVILGAGSGAVAGGTGVNLGAVSLDGGSVEIDGLLGEPASVTLSGWANLSRGGPKGAELISLGDVVAIRLNGSQGRGAGGFYFDGTRWNPTFTSQTYANAGWHHFAYAVDMGAVPPRQTFYVDGRKQAESAFALPIDFSKVSIAHRKTFIGRHGAGSANYSFYGTVDDVRVYQGALTEAAVMELFNDTRPVAPLTVEPLTSITNPVLKATDVPGAHFVADPFLFHQGGAWYLFFETLPTAPPPGTTARRGRIDVATSADGIHWNYAGVALAEGFHLSYPSVFEEDGAYYMIPESYQAKEIRLYTTSAALFPRGWTLKSVLVSGAELVDASIFRFGGKWWMFATNVWKNGTGMDACYLYYSDRLSSGWLQHPLSPVVTGSLSTARLGGRVLLLPEPTSGTPRIIRVAQESAMVNGSLHYGRRTRLFEVKSLSETNYSEEEIEGQGDPFASSRPPGAWNSSGMHQFDPLWTGNHWLIAVDGKGADGRFAIGLYATPHPSAPVSVIESPATDVVVDEGEAVTLSGSFGTTVASRWSFGQRSGIPDSSQSVPGPVRFNIPGVFRVTHSVCHSVLGYCDPTPATRTITVRSTLPFISKQGWSLLSVDSEEISREQDFASNAFDGAATTFWHTRFSDIDPDPPPPHDIQIDLGQCYEINTVSYLPRQDGSPNGRIDAYELFAKTRVADEWTMIADGRFPNDAREKEIGFPPVAARYLRLMALSEVNGRAWASAAEIGAKGREFPCP